METRRSDTSTRTPAVTPEDLARQRALESADGITRVALLLPLSGKHQKLGKAMLNAAELAVEDAGYDRMELIPKDTGGTVEGAAAAADTALQEGAQLILGPLLSSSVRAVHPIANEMGVNVVSFSNDQTVAGDGAYIMGFLPGDQVRQVIQYALSEGRNRIAVLAPDSIYGHLVAAEAQQYVSQSGAYFSKVAFYDPTAPDVSETVRAFASYDSRSKSQKATGAGLDFDAVLLPEGGLKLLQVAPLLPFFDVDPGKVLYMGTGLWDFPAVHKEPNLIGGVFAATPPSARQDFSAKYKSSFGSNPPRLASLAYDATALAVLLSQSPGGPDFSDAAISDAGGFTGADGLLRFSPDGIVERGLAVLRIEKEGLSVVSPARTSFQSAMN